MVRSCVLSAAIDPLVSSGNGDSLPIHDLRLTVYYLNVGEVKCHLLYYSLPGNRHCACAIAVDSAGHARLERLGQ